MGRGMKAGKRPKPQGMGGGNMQKQLQQVQAMQRQMEQIQAELEEREFTATSGGGAVSVTANGKKELKNLVIDKDVVDILAAVNEVMRQVDEVSGQEMGKLTGGLNIPGLM